MGKKGGWFSSIKRVFTGSSRHKHKDKDNPLNLNDKTTKKGVAKLRHGDTNSFIPPLFRKPSSIEKIFSDFEREQQHNSRPNHSSIPTPPRASSPTRIASPRAPSPTPPSPPPHSPPPPRTIHNEITSSRPEPSLRLHPGPAATRIQTAYRGYAARRSFRALKGLVRLQGVVRGQNVKRQTANAMKYMQLVVRVQAEIQARRIHMLEAQARQHAPNNHKWNLGALSEAGGLSDWDDSMLTKEQIDARMQKKVDAIIKRERAMSYAHSMQLRKSSPISTQTTPVRGIPRWYNWLDRQLPSDHRPVTPPIMVPTPLSSHLRPPRGTRDFDDQSLTSCPPFSVPNYMTPTASAKAKAKVRGSDTDSKRRLSFPLWSKPSSSVCSGNNTPNMENRHSAAISVSNFSVHSALSMPAAMSAPARKPFNRFV